MGQNFCDESNWVPHLGQMLPPDCASDVPHFEQKAAPATIGAPHTGQSSMPAPAPDNGVPQLMQRLAVFKLSLPHLGQGLYSCPQKGQNFSSVECFFEQLAQNTILALGC